MTSKKQTSLFTEDQLTSSQGAFPANHTQVQESDSEKKMNAICGPACLEQYEKFNHVGLWGKTFSALLIGMEGWYSKRCKLIWKLKGTKSNRMYFQLRPLAHHTEEIGFGLLPTPRAQEIDNSKERIANNKIDSLPTMAKMNLLPTPIAGDWKGQLRSDGTANMLSGKMALMHKQGMLPTPRANDTNTSTPGTKSFQHRLNRDYIGEVVLNMANAEIGTTSQLSPQFVLEMMGFPTDWTELPFLNGEQNQSKQEAMQ
jgi:hypothetical protein